MVGMCECGRAAEPSGLADSAVLRVWEEFAEMHP